MIFWSNHCPNFSITHYLNKNVRLQNVTIIKWNQSVFFVNLFAQRYCNTPAVGYSMCIRNKSAKQFEFVSFKKNSTHNLKFVFMSLSLFRVFNFYIYTCIGVNSWRSEWKKQTSLFVRFYKFRCTFFIYIFFCLSSSSSTETTTTAINISNIHFSLALSFSSSVSFDLMLTY